MNDIRDGHYTLGKAYLSAEQYDKAIPHFQQSVALDTTFIDGYHALALSYFGAHRLQDAKAAALEALKIDATHSPTLSFLQALDPGASTPPVSVAPAPPDVIATQAETEKEKTAQPTVEAVPTPYEDKEDVQPKADATPATDIDKAPAAPPKADAADDTDIDKTLERGITFLANKQYPQAEAALKKVIKASPNHAVAHYNLAQTYMETGALTDASVEVDTALRLNPSYEPAQQLKEGIRYLADQERQRQFQKKLIRYCVPVAVVVLVVFIGFRYGVFKGILPESTPPALSIDTTLEEPQVENGFIDAGETVSLKLTLTNQGGAAKNLTVRVVPKSIEGLRYQASDRTLSIGKEGFKTLRIPITADKKVRTKRVSLKILVLDTSRSVLATQVEHLSIQSKNPLLDAAESFEKEQHR